jgi:NAD(P)H-flavin reductase
MTASRTPPVPATTDTSPAPIDAAALRQIWDHVSADHEIYVCGSPAMVDDTLTALENAGISLGRVHTDEQAHEETAP